MTPDARIKIAEIYIRQNRLIDSRIRPRIKALIAEAVAPFYLFVESLDLLGVANSTNPCDGLLITLTKRMYETASGILSLLAIGRLQQAEVLSRTLMESSLSLLFITKDDTAERLVQYFESYIRDEEGQNRKWEQELEAVPSPWREEHLGRIKEKSDALNSYKSFIKSFASAIRTPYPAKKGWPKFYDLCNSLDKGVDYRTVYMAMCSQAHSDAEDILNFLMVESAQGIDGLPAKLERETGNFSIYISILSLRYYLECLEYIAARFGSGAAAEQASRSLIEITELAEEVRAGGFVENDLGAWLEKT